MTGSYSCAGLGGEELKETKYVKAQSVREYRMF